MELLSGGFSVQEEIPDSDSVKAKEEAIKKAGCWVEVRDRYLKLKNMYLRSGDYDHPSYIVYVESVNQIYYGLER